MGINKAAIQIARIISEEKKRAERAKITALNRAANSARAQTIQFIRQDYDIKAADLRKEIKIRKANNLNHKVQIEVTHRAVALIKYKARQTKKGVTFLVKKGKRELIKSAFITTVNKGRHTGVFKRKGKERFPIKEIYGPSVMQLMSSNEAKKYIETVFYDRFEKELKRALSYQK